jgi:hypothetical protein
MLPTETLLDFARMMGRAVTRPGEAGGVFKVVQISELKHISYRELSKTIAA